MSSALLIELFTQTFTAAPPGPSLPSGQSLAVHVMDHLDLGSINLISAAVASLSVRP
jgi:hypothetical protein